MNNSSIRVPNAASGAHQQIESFLKTAMQGLIGQETERQRRNGPIQQVIRWCCQVQVCGWRS